MSLLKINKCQYVKLESNTCSRWCFDWFDLQCRFAKVDTTSSVPAVTIFMHVMQSFEVGKAKKSSVVVVLARILLQLCWGKSFRRFMGCFLLCSLLLTPLSMLMLRWPTEKNYCPLLTCNCRALYSEQNLENKHFQDIFSLFFSLPQNHSNLK